jgi:hypothetical protein
VALLASVTGVGESDTLTSDDGETVIVAAADCVLSVMLVAVSVTVAATVKPEGATYVAPVVEVAVSVPGPAPILHVTPALEESLITAAAKIWLAPPASVTGVGPMATLMGAEEAVCFPLQLISRSRQ